MHNRTQSPLLRIPGEIRNEIYKLVVGNRTHQIRAVHTKGWEDPSHLEGVTTNKEKNAYALLAVCRDIHKEAKDFAFVDHTFCFMHKDEMRWWLSQKANRAIASSIRHVELNVNVIAKPIHNRPPCVPRHIFPLNRRDFDELLPNIQSLRLSVLYTMEFCGKQCHNWEAMGFEAWLEMVANLNAWEMMQLRAKWFPHIELDFVHIGGCAQCEEALKARL
jgi:hypothetical protein